MAYSPRKSRQIFCVFSHQGNVPISFYNVPFTRAESWALLVNATLIRKAGMEQYSRNFSICLSPLCQETLSESHEAFTQDKVKTDKCQNKDSMRVATGQTMLLAVIYWDLPMSTSPTCWCLPLRDYLTSWQPNDPAHESIKNQDVSSEKYRKTMFPLQEIA